MAGYEEVNERHACLGSFTTALRRAGRGDFCPFSLTLGSCRYDSRRGGVEGHRPVYGGGCFCLWKRGRKRRPMPPRDARCSLTHFCSGSKKPPAGAGSRGCPGSSRPCLGGHEPAWGRPRAETRASPPAPRAAFPKGSITVQVPQKGEIFESEGFALKIMIPCKHWLLWMWLRASASHGQGCGGRRRTAGPRVWGERPKTDTPQLGRWINYVEATGGRLMSLICQTSHNT